MNFENRDVNRVSFAGRAIIDKSAAAVRAGSLNKRLSRTKCEAAANPAMRVPTRENGVHRHTPRYTLRPRMRGEIVNKAYRETP